MKSTGFVRRLDELGRVVLPIELRRSLNINEKDSLEIFTNNDRIVLQKYVPACLFCGSRSQVHKFKGKNVCDTCLVTLGEKS